MTALIVMVMMMIMIMIMMMIVLVVLTLYLILVRSTLYTIIACLMTIIVLAVAIRLDAKQNLTIYGRIAIVVRLDVIVMSLLVYFECAALSGRILTVGALEWLLARVNSHVNFQMAALHRRIVALGAFEWLNARVFGRMLGQMDLLIEGCTANVAEKRGRLLVGLSIFSLFELGHCHATISVVAHIN